MDKFVMPMKFTLTSFIQAKDNGPHGPSAYVAGFTDDAGEAWGTLVPLSANELEHAVFAHKTFAVGCDMAGEMMAHPTNLDDDLLDAMVRDGRLVGHPIDELVVEALDRAANEPNENAVEEFAKLKDHLERALAAVDHALAERTA